MDRQYRKQPRPERSQREFQNFRAAELYCVKCKRAMPTRERLLLILLDGELHEYVCAGCGSSLGTKRVTGEKLPTIIV